MEEVPCQGRENQWKHTAQTPRGSGGVLRVMEQRSWIIYVEKRSLIDSGGDDHAHRRREELLMISPNSKELRTFLNQIRSCRYCETDGQNMPFVYGSSSSDILVVSEMPPKSAWRDGVGKLWADKDLFEEREKGAPHTLCDEWLTGIMDREEVKRRFFWVQRANCFVKRGKEFAFCHRSSKYLTRAIELIKPKLLIVLGTVDAQYFFQFENLEEVMGEVKKHHEYRCVVLYHPSPANIGRFENRAHREALQLLRDTIAGLKA